MTCLTTRSGLCHLWNMFFSRIINCRMYSVKCISFQNSSTNKWRATDCLKWAFKIFLPKVLRTQSQVGSWRQSFVYTKATHCRLRLFWSDLFSSENMKPNAPWKILCVIATSCNASIWPFLSTQQTENNKPVAIAHSCKVNLVALFFAIRH